MWRNMTESSFIAGRAPEQVELAHALKSGQPELIAVYGRRRVGKTNLIRGFFAEKICLEVTGARAASLKDQLANFVRVLETRVSCPLAVPVTSGHLKIIEALATKRAGLTRAVPPLSSISATQRRCANAPRPFGA
jgi:AAA+ ATPase superfamily predicted ATPase